MSNIMESDYISWVKKYNAEFKARMEATYAILHRISGQTTACENGIAAYEVTASRVVEEVAACVERLESFEAKAKQAQVEAAACRDKLGGLEETMKELNSAVVTRKTELETLGRSADDVKAEAARCQELLSEFLKQMSLISLVPDAEPFQGAGVSDTCAIDPPLTPPSEPAPSAQVRDARPNDPPLIAPSEPASDVGANDLSPEDIERPQGFVTDARAISVDPNAELVWGVPPLNVSSEPVPGTGATCAIDLTSGGAVPHAADVRPTDIKPETVVAPIVIDSDDDDSPSSSSSSILGKRPHQSGSNNSPPPKRSYQADVSWNSAATQIPTEKEKKKALEFALELLQAEIFEPTEDGDDSDAEVDTDEDDSSTGSNSSGMSNRGMFDVYKKNVDRLKNDAHTSDGYRCENLRMWFKLSQKWPKNPVTRFNLGESQAKGLFTLCNKVNNLVSNLGKGILAVPLLASPRGTGNQLKQLNNVILYNAVEHIKKFREEGYNDPTGRQIWMPGQRPSWALKHED